MTPEQIAVERREFEALITGMPYEKSIRRYSSRSTEWPGCYRDIDVHLAWDFYLARAELAQEQVEAMRERCAKVCDEYHGNWISPNDIWEQCAAAIRSIGE